MSAAFTACADLFGRWWTDLESGELPTRWELPAPFEKMDVRPGRLYLIGGAPGSGKTAAIMQIIVDLLRGNADARALVANVEMTPALLVDRIASRLSGVPLAAIADRLLTDDQRGRVQLAVQSLESVAGRLAFLNPPHSLENVAAAADAFKANVLVLDYIQRFSVGDSSKDKREQLESAATVCRRWCDAGAAVFVVSAVARQRGNTGSNYHSLNLASFRGSSELEYGADYAAVLRPGDSGTVWFGCEKNRFGPVDTFLTVFDAARMTFTPAPCGLEGFDAAPAAPPSKSKRAKGA